MALPLCRKLAAPGIISITALTPAPDLPRIEIEGVTFVSRIPDLRERLAEYDLVITHFGLTAFESIHARVPVLLVSPGAYHEALARGAGFISAGTGEQGIRRAPKLLCRAGRVNQRFLRALQNACEAIANRYGLQDTPAQDAAALVRGFSPSFPRACPACGSGAGALTLARFPDRTYRRCRSCALVYMLRLSPPPLEYDRSYFFELYRNQYGKTYLEDFPALTKAANARLDTIQSLLACRGKEGAPRILDIGCAYGAFLAAARDRGFSPAGIDPAEDAARYAREELGLPVSHGFFPEAARDFPPQSFDVICLWYVIEHFEDLQGVFREIRRLLKEGGVLSFATPSFGGVSAKVSGAGFLAKSPVDHFTVWEPKHTARILRGHGFILKKTVISGHHPERFPLVGRAFTRRRQGILYRLCLWISKIFRLGDTFEAHSTAEGCPRRGFQVLP
jgi:SAM-dependent methyltransferase